VKKVKKMKSIKKQKRISNLLFYTLVAAFGFLMLYPIVWMVASSLQPAVQIFNYPLELWPREFMWNNYPHGWAGFGGHTFTRFTRNTLIVVTFAVVGTVSSASIVAFSFARINFKFKKIFFALLMGSVMLPGQLMMIPIFIIFNNIGWVGTFLPLIIPPFLGGGAFNIFLLMQFIRGIPKELDEAAVIDGCSTFGVYLRIILPLMKPALVTIAIFTVLGAWDDFMGPLIYLRAPQYNTIALGLRNFMDNVDGTNWGPLLAMSTFSVVPQLIIFAIFQKSIIEGIATTGIK